jgi:hypothetical protein
MKRLLTLLYSLLAYAVAAPGAAAQDCVGTFPPATLDPNPTTTAIPGFPLPNLFATAAFSPEAQDSTQVWYVGNATTLDGCIGGIRAGDADPTGILVFDRIDIGCFAFDVETTEPYHLAVYDFLGNPTRSGVETPGRLQLEDFSHSVWRVVLTPGEVSGARVPLCVDNLVYLISGVPVAPASWGAVKILYR